MDKQTKFLRSLSAKEFGRVQAVLADLIQGRKLGKKLQGHTDIYRVRVGRVRIIYHSYESRTEIMQVGYRDDQTYKDF